MFLGRKIYQERKEKGKFHRLITKLADEELFFQMFRMTSKQSLEPF